MFSLKPWGPGGGFYGDKVFGTLSSSDESLVESPPHVSRTKSLSNSNCRKQHSSSTPPPQGHKSSRYDAPRRLKQRKTDITMPGHENSPYAAKTPQHTTAIPVPPRRQPGPSNKRPRRWGPTGHEVMIVDSHSFLERRAHYLYRSISELSETSQSSSYLQLLLGPPDEDADDEGCSATVTSSIRSTVSTSSVPSLEADDVLGFTESLCETPTAQSNRKANPPRHHLRFCESEPCADDHPLLQYEEQFDSLDCAPLLPEAKKEAPRPLSTFKSNLSASLKVIKSAAQAVSNFTAATRSDDFLVRSFCHFPSAGSTDTRRPDPSLEPTVLRNYLDPYALPAFEEFPRGQTLGVNHNPRTVQMRTYRKYCIQGRPSADLPCEHLNQPDSFDRNDDEDEDLDDLSIPSHQHRKQKLFLPRQARENCDFLRMAVLETNMRRRGKLRDDCAGHARYALPPCKGPPLPVEMLSSAASRTKASYMSTNPKTVPTRWVPLLP